MKKLNLSLMAIFALIAVMPQSIFSMVPQKLNQPADTIEFQYLSPTLRRVKTTGALQMREGSQWVLADQTLSNNYKWLEIKRNEEEDPIMNLESSSEENNNFE